MSAQPSPCFLNEPSKPAGHEGFCSSCGTATQPGAKFCPECGQILNSMRPAPKASVASELFMAPATALTRPAAILAPAVPAIDVAQPGPACHCKAPLPPDAVFCPKCGAKVGETPVKQFLVLMASQGTGPRCEISRDEMTIGKDSDCDVVLGQDEYVSRRHARITRSNGMLFIEDLNSSNGTSLRVRRPIILEPNDEIVIGTKVLRLEETR